MRPIPHSPPVASEIAGDAIVFRDTHTITGHDLCYFLPLPFFAGGGASGWPSAWNAVQSTPKSASQGLHGGP